MNKAYRAYVRAMLRQNAEALARAVETDACDDVIRAIGDKIQHGVADLFGGHPEERR